MPAHVYVDCSTCGTRLAVWHQSYLDPVPDHSRAIAREIVNGLQQEDGSTLTVATDDGVVVCPRCQTELARIEQEAGSSGPPTSLSDELGELGRLHASGVLSDDEFAAAKNQLLGRQHDPSSSTSLPDPPESKGLKSEFAADAWVGFVQMFAASHGLVSKADGKVDDAEVDLLFSILDGTYTGAPRQVLESFNADPTLAREVLADKDTFVRNISPDDEGAAASRAPQYLLGWIQASPSDPIRDMRSRLLRGLLVEVMYLGLQAGRADGAFYREEYEAWQSVGDLLGLPDEWLDQLVQMTA